MDEGERKRGSQCGEALDCEGVSEGVREEFKGVVLNLGVCQA